MQPWQARPPRGAVRAATVAADCTLPSRTGASLIEGGEGSWAISWLPLPPMSMPEVHRKSRTAEPAKNQKWLWTALATGNADLVEKNDPGPDFDWNGSSKTYGTPLMAVIFSGPRTSDRGCTDFVTDNEAQFQNRLRLIRWMIMEKGTDPKKEETAGCCADKSWSITDDDEVHSQTRTLSFRGHSAFSALLEVRMHMLAAEGDWRSDISRIDRIFEVFSATRPKEKMGKPHTVMVHEAVMEMWERFLDNDSGKDLTIRCMRDQEVLGTVQVHSGLLASASVVVKAMLSGPMREGTMNTIDVECRVDSMKLLLSLVYTGSVTADSDEQLPAEVMLGCLDVAHRWDVRHVVQMLVPQLCASLTVDNLGQVWESAILKQQQELLSACRAFAHNAATEVRPLFEAGRFGRLVAEELTERVFTDTNKSPKRRRRTFS